MVTPILTYSAYTSSSAAIATPFALAGFGFASVISIIFSIIWLAAFVIGVLGFILWIIMFIDVLQRKSDQFPNGSNDSQLLWILIMLFTSSIGAFLYYFLVYKKMPRNSSTVEIK